MNIHHLTVDCIVQVVPKGRARIRVQISAAHSEESVDLAAAAFAEVGKELGVV